MSKNTNLSPWLDQVNTNHQTNPVSENRQTDIAIIGGGIAGMATAFYLLTTTNKKIYIVESDKLASGATGHNAGQVVSYSERQISDLAKEFGIEKTAQSQRNIDSAWDLLQEIYKKANLTLPFAQFTGYAGCQDLDEILVHLENNKYARATHINMEPMMISQDSPVVGQIPSNFDGLYSLVPHQNILDILETNDTRYIAALCGRKGVLNTALFCHQLLDYLFQNFAERFSLFEQSHVETIELGQGNAKLKVNGFEVTCQNVVLCTNGFEKFEIKNLVGDEINNKFHHFLKGTVGYMAGYLETHTRSPIAISYLPTRKKLSEGSFDNGPYFYLTRRTFEDEDNQSHSLICVGGPERRLDDSSKYHRNEHPYSQEAHKAIDDFLHTTYRYAPSGFIDYRYLWHGLMGYTQNGVRIIGPEPANPVLLYNLGCNGVGILPSIYGGKKISQIVNGKQLEESIFDPHIEKIE